MNKHRLTLSVIILLISSILTWGQGLINFDLKPSGVYKSPDGKDFIVVPFDGKSSHHIFQEIMMNVNSLYKKPSEVVTTVEDKSIKIYAYSNEVIRARVLGMNYKYGGFFQLEFKIRDGRVRVSAPVMDEEVQCTNTEALINGKFSNLAKRHFKNGVIKNNTRKEDLAAVTEKMNMLINTLLNLNFIQDTNDDW